MHGKNFIDTPITYSCSYTNTWHIFFKRFFRQGSALNDSTAISNDIAINADYTLPESGFLVVGASITPPNHAPLIILNNVNIIF